MELCWTNTWRGIDTPGKPWSEEEVVLLRDLYPKIRGERARGYLITLQEWLPNRTIGGIREKTRQFGLPKPREKPWSDRELNILRELYPSAPKEELLKRLAPRTIHAMRCKARELGVWRGYLKSDGVELTPHIAEIVAWIIACEGTISIHSEVRGKYFSLNPYITIGNTNLTLLERFRDLVGCGHISKGTKAKGYRKESWGWKLTKTIDIFEFLCQIYPHLPIKKKECKLVMVYCDSRIRNDSIRHIHYTEREVEIWRELRELNRRGAKRYLEGEKGIEGYGV